MRFAAFAVDGMIKWRGEQVFVGEALAGELIGLAETESGGHIARFCHHDLGVIDRDRLFPALCSAACAGRVGAMDRSTAPLTEPDARARIRLFGLIDQRASKSWSDACGVLSSSQRVLSETSRPANQDGG